MTPFISRLKRKINRWLDEPTQFVQRPPEIPLEEYFRYHAPTTAARTNAHEAINNGALIFAKVIDEYCGDDRTRELAMGALMQARLFANQSIVVDELRHQLPPAVSEVSPTRKYQC